MDGEKIPELKVQDSKNTQTKTSEFLMKRMQKGGVKYFDSGEYNVNKSKTSAAPKSGLISSSKKSEILNIPPPVMDKASLRIKNTPGMSQLASECDEESQGSEEIPNSN